MISSHELTCAILAKKDSHKLEFCGSIHEWIDHMIDIPDNVVGMYVNASKQVRSVLVESIAEIISISIMDKSMGGFHTAIRAIGRLHQAMVPNMGGGGGKKPKNFAGSKRKPPPPPPPPTKKTVSPTPKDRKAHLLALELHKTLTPAMQTIIAAWGMCIGKHLYNPRRHFGREKSVFRRPLYTILGFWDTRTGTTLRVASQFIPSQPKTASYTFRILENGTIRSQCGQTYILADALTWEELNQS